MAFDPERFIDSAEGLLRAPSTQANFRTAMGRAYFAVYGVFRERVCEAKGVTPRALFGRSGRHGHVVRLVGMSADFKRLHIDFQALMAMRVNSDYRYHLPDYKRPDVESAVDSAKDAIALMKRTEKAAFRAFPLMPQP